MAEDVTASTVRLSVPPVLLAFGLLPPCLREKNSWMYAVCLNPTHSHQRVPEACFYQRRSQLHTVAAAVRDHSVKSIHHVHQRLTSAGSNNTCFSQVSLSFITRLMDGVRVSVQSSSLRAETQPQEEPAAYEGRHTQRSWHNAQTPTVYISLFGLAHVNICLVVCARSEVCARAFGANGYSECIVMLLLGKQ